MLVPVRQGQADIVVRKSRFIATAGPAQSRQQAMAILEQARRRFADSRHHCWAYRTGTSDNALSAAMSDDGEPAGTAGKPILNVLQHKRIGNVMLVVSRYFGGIKLGAGGLVRAYSAAARAVIDSLPLVQFVEITEAAVAVQFSQEQHLRHWLETHSGEVRDTAYGELVHCVVSLPLDRLDSLRHAVEQFGWKLITPDHP